MLELSKNCRICPRLADFRDENRKKFPDKFNAPVPAFGPVNAPFLIVGLAPGLKGANFTGRPFTGDYAGELLYQTLITFGFATGEYKAHPNDGLTLTDCRITNAVKCLPPENKPTTDEMKNCLPFFKADRDEMPNLKVILALGKIAHDSVLRLYGLPLSSRKFAHAARHELPGEVVLIDSYHCSRYNTQTGRLTTGMFEDVIKMCRDLL